MYLYSYFSKSHISILLYSEWSPISENIISEYLSCAIRVSLIGCTYYHNLVICIYITNKYSTFSFLIF